MPALDPRLKRTTLILTAIQECKCGTRIDVSRFEAFQELTCPGCAGCFVVQGQPEPGHAASSGFPAERNTPGGLQRMLRGKGKMIAVIGTACVVLIAGIAQIRKARARDAVSPIPQLPSASLPSQQPQSAAPSLVTSASNTSTPARAVTGAVQAGLYKLKNRQTNQVVDVYAWNSNQDAQIKTWSSVASLNQRWIVRPLGAGYQLVALHSCKALEVLGGTADDGAAIRQGMLTGATNQIWNFDPAGDGFYRIVAKCSGKALTVLDTAAKSGAPLGQRAISDEHAQHWKLEPLGGWPAELNPVLEGRPLGAAPAPVRATQGSNPAGGKFVPIDLSSVYNCDSRKGNFSRPDSLKDTVRPLLFGWVQAGGAVFQVLDAAKTGTGKDLLILRGGLGPPRTSYPKSVEVNVDGAPLTKLHFLGGVGGWGYPWDKTDKHLGVLAAQVTVVRRGGAQEILQFRNGIEFAEYHYRVDVPGSAYVEGFADYERQVRYFSKALSGSDPVEKLIIEGFETNIAPVFVAITGEVR